MLSYSKFINRLKNNSRSAMVKTEFFLRLIIIEELSAVALKPPTRLIISVIFSSLFWRLYFPGVKTYPTTIIIL